MAEHTTDETTTPAAVITRTGRWTYRVYIQDGITIFGPDVMQFGSAGGWHVLGWRHAVRKARRELRHYLDRPERERWEIHAGTDDA